MNSNTPKVKLRAGRHFPVSLDSAHKRLGVTKGHLSHVLNGHRKSESLTQRYKALVEELQG